MNRDLFNACVETRLARTLRHGDVVILDNLPTHKSAFAAEVLKSVGAWFVCRGKPSTGHFSIQEIAMTLNLTPRKCFGFRSSIEAFLAELGKDVDISFNGRVALRG